jgi:hypothetical protein
MVPKNEIKCFSTIPCCRLNSAEEIFSAVLFYEKHPQYKLLFIATIAFAGIQDARLTSVWSWRRFLLILGFALLECAIITMSAYYIHDVHNPWSWPVYIASWIVALANFIWMILIVRRWTQVKDHSR